MPGLLPELVCRRHELLPRFAVYYTQLRALPRRVRRALQRQWRLPLAGVALMLALGQNPGLAATIPVSADCILVDAITAANSDTATGGCMAGSGADTIVLPAGSTQTLTEVNNSTYGPTGLPVITSVISMAGQGSTITRDGGVPDFRLFAVNSTGDLTLQETTVSGGRVSSDPVTSVRFLGGGITNYDGTVTVTNSTISSNSAYGAGGVFSRGGLLTVINSTITGNSAYGVGGGVGDSFGTVTVTNSTIAANSAVFGGGVANSPYSTVTVTNSIISSNSASSTGGGVHNFGTVTVINSTITGNSAGGNGGGVRNFGTVTVTNSTISSNSAYVAGGVSNGGYATITLVRTLIACNLDLF
jgi:hypothetical protein